MKANSRCCKKDSMWASHTPLSCRQKWLSCEDSSGLASLTTKSSNVTTRRRGRFERENLSILHEGDLVGSFILDVWRDSAHRQHDISTRTNTWKVTHCSSGRASSTLSTCSVEDKPNKFAVRWLGTT